MSKGTLVEVFSSPRPLLGLGLYELLTTGDDASRFQPCHAALTDSNATALFGVSPLEFSPVGVTACPSDTVEAVDQREQLDQHLPDDSEARSAPELPTCSSKLGGYQGRFDRRHLKIVRNKCRDLVHLFAIHLARA